MTNDQTFLEAALLRTMTLLATLNAAAELTFGMRERKAGRDPSFDEHASVAIPVIAGELQTLRTLIFQLQSSLAITDATERVAGEPTAEPVNRFIDLMRLQKAGFALQSIHQRLLSLYPAVNEDLAEQARVLQNTAVALKDYDSARFMPALSIFVQDAETFMNQLADVAEV